MWSRRDPIQLKRSKTGRFWVLWPASPGVLGADRAAVTGEGVKVVLGQKPANGMRAKRGRQVQPAARHAGQERSGGFLRRDPGQPRRGGPHPAMMVLGTWRGDIAPAARRRGASPPAQPRQRPPAACPPERPIRGSRAVADTSLVPAGKSQQQPSRESPPSGRPAIGTARDPPASRLLSSPGGRSGPGQPQDVSCGPPDL
jgi:hypothetical protein